MQIASWFDLVDEHEQSKGFSLKKRWFPFQEIDLIGVDTGNVRFQSAPVMQQLCKMCRHNKEMQSRKHNSETC